VKKARRAKGFKDAGSFDLVVILRESEQPPSERTVEITPFAEALLVKNRIKLTGSEKYGKFT